MGHTTETLRILAADIVSEPYNGAAYAAGEHIEVRIFLNGPVRVLTTPLTVPLHLGEGSQHRREARSVTIRGDFTSYSVHPSRPNYRTYVLYFAYTVQSGDVDADGIVLGADPLGTASDRRIEYALDNRVGMDLSFPAQTPGAGQRVDGSQTSTCDAVHCAYVTAVDTTVSSSFSGYFGPGRLGQTTGNMSGRLFGYGGQEYFFSRNAVSVTEPTDGGAGASGIEIWFTGPLGEQAAERLGWQVGDTAFAFADAETFSSDAPTSEEEGFEQLAAYYWLTTGLRWRGGDRTLVKIVEMPVTATFNAMSYSGDEGGSFDVRVTLGDYFETKTVTLPIVATGVGGATDADYSGVPESLVFAPGETEKTFTVTVADDTVDDDDESITLSFGTEPNVKDGGANEEATITINDDDDPEVAVSFGAVAYRVDESDDSQTPDATENEVAVTVNLSADPERTVEDPPHGDEPGRRHIRRLLRRPVKCDLRCRRDRADRHFHGCA